MTDNPMTEQPLAAHLSADINEALREMISINMSINNLYKEETILLKDNDTKGFMRLQPRKVELATAYQNGSMQLVDRKAEIALADEGLKQRLKDLRHEFSHIGAENNTALEKIHKNVKRLSDRILQIARDATKKSQIRGYNSAGATTSAQKSVAVSISEEV